MTVRTTLAALVLAASLPIPAMAGGFSAFESDLRDAYAAYRTALFQSNAGNADATTAALDALSNRWQEITADWGATPPPQYADDPGYAATLAAVAGVIDRAGDDLAAGDLAATHLTLEDLREELAALHERNGILTFSDRMNAYHAKMEEVLDLDLLPEGGGVVLAEHAAVLAYLADDIAAHPAPEAGDPAYTGMVAALTNSVEALRSAARSGDVAAVTAAMAGLKPAYARLFARFG